jgi:hypothetical protein
MSAHDPDNTDQEQITRRIWAIESSLSHGVNPNQRENLTSEHVFLSRKLDKLRGKE